MAVSDRRFFFRMETHASASYSGKTSWQ
jgi:hypothetical protein